MLSAYRLFTITHRQASLQQLEPYVLASTEMDATLSRLRVELDWQEVFYVNTCNRVLFFFYQDNRDPSTATDLQRALGIDTTSNLIDPVFLMGKEAVLHLYDVAASVDSMVVGEREILRQLRLAYLACHEGGHCGDNLRMLMQSAVAAAKTVYHQTRIGQKPVSVVSLAAQRIRQHRLDPEKARVLLIGAGQTNWLMSKFLRNQGFVNVDVANRSLEKAVALAKSFGGNGISLEDLNTYKKGFDLLIVCTGSTQAIVTEPLFKALLNGESAEDKVVVDLSIPHNVSSTVVEQFSPVYIQIDDLRKLAESNLAFRSNEVQAARKLIGQQLSMFRARVQQRSVELALGEVPHRVRQIKNRALEEVFSKELKDLDDNTVDLIERMMNYMEKKCVGIPMKVAREAVTTVENEIA